MVQGRRLVTVLRERASLAPVVAAVVAATFMYWPALRSGFYHDDYIYLVASRDIPFTTYLWHSLIPGSTDPTLHFQQSFWRPLYFLSFRGLYALYGDSPLGYHLVVFAIHVSGVAVVWSLARRLTKSSAAAGLAAIVFAVYPLGFESATWISSLNSAAFPLALGSWLAFICAVDKGERGRSITFHIVAAGLFVLALGFRENVLSIAPVVVVWYFLCFIGLRQARELVAWKPLVPYFVICVAYVGLRTMMASTWVTPDPAFSVGWIIVRQSWAYLRLVFVPFLPLHDGWPNSVRIVAALTLVALLPVMLMTRRYLATTLLFGIIVAVFPFSLVVGVTPRYAYFPAAFVALTVAAAAASLWRGGAAQNRLRRFVPVAYLGAVLAIAIGGAWLGHHRVTGWAAEGPNAEDRWLDGLRAQYPRLEPGDTLYVAGAPVAITLFNGVSLDAAVAYYYPEVAKVVVLNLVHPEPGGPQPRPGDPVYIYQPR